MRSAHLNLNLLKIEGTWIKKKTQARIAPDIGRNAGQRLLNKV